MIHSKKQRLITKKYLEHEQTITAGMESNEVYRTIAKNISKTISTSTSIVFDADCSTRLSVRSPDWLHDTEINSFLQIHIPTPQLIETHLSTYLDELCLYIVDEELKTNRQNVEQVNRLLDRASERIREISFTFQTI